jgi:hypothetical protein
MPSMYRATVPVLIRGLKILSTLLEKGEAHAKETGADLTGARLAPDMLTLVGQIQRISDTSKGAIGRLTEIVAQPGRGLHVRPPPQAGEAFSGQLHELGSQAVGILAARALGQGRDRGQPKPWPPTDRRAASGHRPRPPRRSGSIPARRPGWRTVVGPDRPLDQLRVEPPGAL